MNCFTDDYDSLQSQSDVVKTESQMLPSAAAVESLGAVSSNVSEGVDLSVDAKMSSKMADDDEVLNLVKVKEPAEPAETEAGSVTKEEDDQKRDVKISKLLKSESGDDVKKEHEKDDEDTLSESETTAGVKPEVTSAVSADAVKDEAATKLIQKDDADEEIDHSAVPSPCPEVR